MSSNPVPTQTEELPYSMPKKPRTIKPATQAKPAPKGAWAKPTAVAGTSKCTCKSPEQGSYNPAPAKPAPKQTIPQPASVSSNQNQKKFGDSLDQQMKQVDSQLFQSKAANGGSSNAVDSSGLGKVSISQSGSPLDTHTGNVGANLFSSNVQRVTVNKPNLTGVGSTIDDSEFYRSVNMVDNTKETIVEKNIKEVLEQHMENRGDHKPCKVPPQLYEKLPMQKEGIYKKDYKEQDLNISKPHYGEANNPYDCFMPEALPTEINSIYRKDFVPKQLKNSGEPDIRDVVSSINDFAKHLKAPKPNDTLYKVNKFVT